MRIIFSFLFASLLNVAVLADHPQKHYQATIPENYAQAVAQLQAMTEAAEHAADKGDLRRMHEVSYDIEAALHVMQAELAAIAEQVETMHQASERNRKAQALDALKEFAPKVQALTK